jgi:hypothetical protein
LDGFPIKFYKGCFEIIREDLLILIEYSRRTGQIHAPFNATFIDLIPKVDNPKIFDQFRPISLCNSVYKIISKIISHRIKDILSENISEEKFRFLQGRQIHQEIDIAQEGLHSIHTQKKRAITYKVDLSKAFDRVNWLYIRLLLIHLGFEHSFVTWVMNCISSTSFSLLINGSTTSFFRVECGLFDRDALYPHYLFLLVVESLSRLIHNEVNSTNLKGIKISLNFSLTHLLFVDDILIFCEGNISYISSLKEILQTFYLATCMQINMEKSSLYSWGMSEIEN